MKLMEYYVIKKKGENIYLSAILYNGVCWQDGDSKCMRFLSLEQAKMMFTYIIKYVDVEEKEYTIRRIREEEEDLY